MDNSTVPIKELPKAKFSKIQIVVFVLIVILSLITIFVSGFFLNNVLINENTDTQPNIIPEETNIDIVVPNSNETTNFLPGKYYFDDTIILVSKEEPHYTLVATAARSQTSNGNYNQNTRVSFFNGVDWTRKLKTQSTLDSQIQNNELIKNWEIKIDNSKVLKQTVEGSITVDNNNINFTTPTLENEIGVRSLPGYTKFMSEGTGKIIINNAQYDSYVLYTRIYSLNASDLFTYDGDFRLLTDWIAFWDQEGNFYHIDNTQVEKTLPNYQTHSLGIFKNSKEGIQKTFVMEIKRDENKPPTNYTALLSSPIDSTLRFERLNFINKSPDNSYTWGMGNIKGNVTDESGRTTQGIGLVEYIYK